MAINRKLTTAKSVKWNGDEAARVRGLTPNDIALILEREGESLKTVLDVLDEVDLAGIGEGETDKLADRIMAAGPGIVVHLSKMLPRFLAAVIVVASDGDEDDIDYVASDWPLALQFLALADIATLTFSGPEGFKAFVGNVLGLVGLAKTLTGADKNTGTAALTQSDGGASTSSN